jgi:curli production assembly/transport component CsgE
MFLNRILLLSVVAGCFFLIPFTGQAAQNNDGIEISGLLIEDTLTRAGRDFFYFFNSNWQPLRGNFTLKVKERQDRGSSTSILIFINDTLVFQSPLARLPDALEESAKNAVTQTRNYILYQREALKELDYY